MIYSCFLYECIITKSYKSVIKRIQMTLWFIRKMPDVNITAQHEAQFAYINSSSSVDPLQKSFWRSKRQTHVSHERTNFLKVPIPSFPSTKNKTYHFFWEVLLSTSEPSYPETGQSISHTLPGLFFCNLSRK